MSRVHVMSYCVCWAALWPAHWAAHEVASGVDVYTNVWIRLIRLECRPRFDKSLHIIQYFYRVHYQRSVMCIVDLHTHTHSHTHTHNHTHTQTHTKS